MHCALTSRIARLCLTNDEVQDSIRVTRIVIQKVFQFKSGCSEQGFWISGHDRLLVSCLFPWPFQYTTSLGIERLLTFGVLENILQYRGKMVDCAGVDLQPILHRTSDIILGNDIGAKPLKTCHDPSRMAVQNLCSVVDGLRKFVRPDYHAFSILDSGAHSLNGGICCNR